MSDNETGTTKELKNQEEEEEEDEEEEEENVRDISESSDNNDAIVPTKGGDIQTPEADTGLLDTKILDITSSDQYGNRGSTVALNTNNTRLSTPRVTRFLYFYFMLGFFLTLFFCIIWGFLGISYLFLGYPGVGLAYFGGLFIPSLWAASLLILDFIVWNKNKDTPRRPLVINLKLCCNRLKYRNGKELTQGWYFIIFLYIWFGILLALPAGSWALPIAAISLSIIVSTVIIDWEYYYMKGDFNGIYGIHINPWRYLILTSIIQFCLCVIIVMGHFMGHWRCIYEPEYYSDSEHFNICHDWIPYELMAVVYGLLLFIYFYKRFQGDTLDSNVLDKRVRYYMWFQSLLLLIAIIWMIVEIFDGHVYIYDVIGFIYLWFVSPVFVVISRSFKVR